MHEKYRYNNLSLIVVLFIILCLLPQQSKGIIEEKTVTPGHWVSHYNNFQRFGFDRGGKIEISGYMDNPSVNTFLYICDQSEFQYRLRNENWIKWLCEDPERALGMRAPLDGKKYEFTVYHKQLYFLNIIDCSDSRWVAHVEYTLYSNGHSHISLDEIELPLIYFILIILWTVLLLVWLTELIGNRRHSSPMYLILFGVILLKFAVIGIMYFYYWKYSTTGHCYDILSTFQGFLVSISEMAFFMAIYLISKGWRIVYSGLPAREIRSTVIAIIVLIFTLIFFSIYNPDYYWLSLILMYFLLVPKIFTSISQNLRLLDSQIDLFQQNSSIPPEPYTSLLREKLNMYLRIRNGLLVYLLSILIINTILKILLPWDYLWISRLCDEVMVLIMIGFVLFCLRPSRKIFFSSYEEMRPFLNLVDFLQRRGDMETIVEVRSTQEPWDISKTMVFKWPKKGKKNRHLTRTAMSLGYEEKYDEMEMRD